MSPIIDELRYRTSNILQDSRYKIQDLAADPKGRIKLAASALAILILLIVASITLSRLLAPEPEPPQGVTQAKAATVGASSWIPKAQAALADDPRFADITIETRKLKAGKSGVRISGMVPDMAARLEAMQRLNELGVPENLELDLMIDPASIEP
jgi:hypothetical protein